MVAASVPLTWFSAMRASARSITVRYGFSSGGVPSSQILGVVVAHERSSVSASRAVVMELPYRSLAAGEVATVQVMANAVYSVAAWQLRVQVDNGLSITSANIDARRWTAETTSPSAQVIDLTGFLADETSASSAPVTGLESLFTLTVRASSGVSFAASCNITTGAGCPRVNGTVVRLSSVRNPEVRAHPEVQPHLRLRTHTAHEYVEVALYQSCSTMFYRAARAQLKAHDPLGTTLMYTILLCRASSNAYTRFPSKKFLVNRS